MRGYYSIDGQVFNSACERDIQNESVRERETVGLNNSIYFKVAFDLCEVTGGYKNIKTLRVFNGAHLDSDLLRVLIVAYYNQDFSFKRLKNGEWKMNCRIFQIDGAGLVGVDTVEPKENYGNLYLDLIILKSIPYGK